MQVLHVEKEKKEKRELTYHEILQLDSVDSVFNIIFDEIEKIKERLSKLEK